MARRGNGAWSKYRSARARLAELEAARDTLQRSRPRTRGKKAAKTRALNKLARQIPAAKGLLTKARKAIAKAAASQAVGKSAARQKRSEAAKRGWAKRQAGKPSQAATPVVSGSNRAMPFLTHAGIVGVWPPAKDDRSKIGKYFGQVDRMLAHMPHSFEQFEGDSIYDEISGKRLPFITDVDFILMHSDEFHFGFSFYRDRHEFTKVA
ncbi:MAG TPA: hypothetical protein VGI19_09260 [Candidatus Cybelea sp.]|jgi:hypothetical protein